MQKYVKVGNSMAVTLDNGFVKQHNIKPGRPVVMVYDDRGIFSGTSSKQLLSDKTLSDVSKKTVIASKITPELKQWTERFLLENQVAMKKLADL